MTDQLQEARGEINRIDEEIARLFVQRMQAVERAAAYKRAHGLPVLDAGREQALIARNLSFIDSTELRAYYEPLQREMLRVSRLYQERLAQKD